MRKDHPPIVASGRILPLSIDKFIPAIESNRYCVGVRHRNHSMAIEIILMVDQLQVGC